jgi:hypothetical protein
MTSVFLGLQASLFSLNGTAMNHYISELELPEFKIEYLYKVPGSGIYYRRIQFALNRLIQSVNQTTFF